MKKRVIIFLFFIFVLSNGSFCQTEKVSISVRDVPLTAVLDELAENYNRNFAYDVDLLMGINVTADVSEEDVFAVLDDILREIDLHYKLVGNTIAIYPEKKRTVFRIRGSVFDEESGEVLPYASILVKGGPSGTSTLENGSFAFDVHPEEDSVILLVKYMGYRTKELFVAKNDMSRALDIRLQKEIALLEGVDINADEEEAVNVGERISHFSVSIDKLSSIPNVGDMDVFTFLNFLPGISMSNEFASGLSIRGSYADQNMLLFDGFSIYKQDHCFGVFSAINPAVVKEIQVFKGGFDSKYGGKIGGVVDITGKSGNQFKPSVSAGMNMISANLTVETPILNNKGSLILAGRRSFTDLIRTPYYDEIFRHLFSTDSSRLSLGGSKRLYSNQLVPELYFYDLNARLTYMAGEKDKLSLSLYNSKDVLNIEDLENEFFDSENWTSKAAGFSWKRRWNSRHESDLQLSYSNFNNDFVQNYFVIDTTASSTGVIDTTYYFEDGNIYQHISEYKWKLNNFWEFNSKGTLEYGLEQVSYLVDHLESSVYFPEDLIIGDGGRLSSGFLQMNYLFGGQWSISPGIRASYYNLTKGVYFEPRISTRLKLTESLYLKASAGKYNQFLSSLVLSDLNGGYNYVWMLSDEIDLPIVSSSQFIAGFNFSKSDFLVDVEFYRKDVSGLSRFLPGMDSAYFNNQEYIHGNARIQGVDVLVKNSFGPLQAWLAYTYSDNVLQYAELNLGEAFPSNNHKKHEVDVTAMYGKGNWEFSATWKLKSGAPYSLPVDSSSNQVYEPLTNINTQRLPAYHRLDLSASYKMMREKFGATVGLSLINVYNRQNIRSRLYYIDYENYEDGYPYKPVDILQFGFIPNVFVKLQF